MSPSVTSITAATFVAVGITSFDDWLMLTWSFGCIDSPVLSDAIFAIMDGSIVDKNSRKVLSVGDIVKKNDLKTLSKVFKIKKSLRVLTVLKK